MNQIVLVSIYLGGEPHSSRKMASSERRQKKLRDNLAGRPSFFIQVFM